mmetsp:Transcript_86873/g.202234  ORF Transcript_86873/g.202234 Transcript_86873/m.202234 type:complete len:591 (-) Transcript_86873:185-1957(-)
MDYAQVCARLEEQETLIKELFQQQREELKEQFRTIAEQLDARSKRSYREDDSGKLVDILGPTGSRRLHREGDSSRSMVDALGRTRSRRFAGAWASRPGLQHEEVIRMQQVLRYRDRGRAKRPPGKWWPAPCSDEHVCSALACNSDESEDESETEESVVLPPQRFATRDEIIPHNSMQACLLPVVSSMWFQTLVGAVVVLNAIALGVDVDRKMKHHKEYGRDENSPAARVTWTEYTEVGFILFFSTEMLLRFCAEQWDFFWGPNVRWNVFEGTIVVCSLAEVASIFRLQGASSLRILRLLRIVRAVRVVRVFRFLHQLRLMLFSLLSCFLSMVWAILLLLLLMYLFALYLEEAALSHLERYPKYHDDHSKESIISAKLKEHWNGVLPAMFSLIESISGGADWGDLAEPFMEIWWVHGSAYTLFVLFTTLGIFNILVGIFVQEAERVADWDKNLVVQEELMKMESTLQTLEDVFHSIDIDGDDFISYEELAEALDNQEVNAYLSHLDIDTTTASILFGLLDDNRDSRISREEFVTGFLRLKGGAKPTELALLMQHSHHIMMRLEDMELLVCRRIHAIEQHLSMNPLKLPRSS